MKILLTGASGFIGSYFKDKYSDLYSIQTFSFSKNDFTNLDLTGVETIVHLSALVHQTHDENTERYKQINISQTLNLAKKAKEIGVKHFIFMSTIKVFGEESYSPYSENSLCAPEDDYGKSKYIAEQELQKLISENFAVSIIRTPIVYGYSVKANMKNLINLVRKTPILPFRDIHNKRSIVYVGNLSHLINCVIKQQQSGIFLASDDAPLSTSLLIQLIAKELDKKVYLIKIPFFETLLKLIKPSLHKRLFESLEVNNTLTKNKLHLKNPYTTIEGIHNMIQGEVECP